MRIPNKHARSLFTHHALRKTQAPRPPRNMLKCKCACSMPKPKAYCMRIQTNVLKNIVTRMDPNELRPRKKSMSKTKSAAPVGKASVWGAIKQPSTPITYHLIDPNLLCDAIHVCAENGDALLLGKTSDGGALSMLWFRAGDRIKLYASEVEVVVEALEEVIAYYP